MFRVGCDHSESALFESQFRLSHQSQYPFVIDDHRTSSEFMGDSSVSIARVLTDDLSDLFQYWLIPASSGIVSFPLEPVVVSALADIK